MFVKVVVWLLGCMKEKQLEQVVKAVIQRYRVIRPDWDIVYLALPKDPVQRSVYWKQAQQLDGECRTGAER